MDKSIPKATAKRLSLYYRIFKRFNTDGIEKASSKQIADALGIDSATVRRDFSYFGELGRRGFGYDVKKLMNFFAEILNDHSTTNEFFSSSFNITKRYHCSVCRFNKRITNFTLFHEPAAINSSLFIKYLLLLENYNIYFFQRWCDLGKQFPDDHMIVLFF